MFSRYIVGLNIIVMSYKMINRDMHKIISRFKYLKQVIFIKYV